eukprot:Rhum_TRINITY_DN12983_c0_g1::Rhum_TRINITY_DN12983_c0_g1_i1::g.55956::m.55956
MAHLVDEHLLEAVVLRRLRVVRVQRRLPAAAGPAVLGVVHQRQDQVRPRRVRRQRTRLREVARQHALDGGAVRALQPVRPRIRHVAFVVGVVGAVLRRLVPHAEDVDVRVVAVPRLRAQRAAAGGDALLRPAEEGGRLVHVLLELRLVRLRVAPREEDDVVRLVHGRHHLHRAVHRLEREGRVLQRVRRATLEAVRASERARPAAPRGVRVLEEVQRAVGRDAQVHVAHVVREAGAVPVLRVWVTVLVVHVPRVLEVHLPLVVPHSEHRRAAAALPRCRHVARHDALRHGALTHHAQAAVGVHLHEHPAELGGGGGGSGGSGGRGGGGGQGQEEGNCSPRRHHRENKGERGVEGVGWEGEGEGGGGAPRVWVLNLS